MGHILKIAYPSSTTDFLKRVKSSQVYIPPKGESTSEGSGVNLPISLWLEGGRKLDLMVTQVADLDFFRELKLSLGLKTN